jgi:valyl-tRNA synthetase
MSASWPAADDLVCDACAEADIALAQTVLSSVRKLRQQNAAPERKPVRVTVAAHDDGAVAGLRRAEALVLRLGFIERLEVGRDPERPRGAAADLADGLEVLLDLDGLVDREAQRADLQRSLERIDKQRAGASGKLANEQFVARAPAEVVDKERARLVELDAERARLAGLLAALGEGPSAS